MGRCLTQLLGGIVSATRLVTRARGWLRIILATLAAFALAYTMAPTQALAVDPTGSVSGTITGSDKPGVGIAGITVSLNSTDWSTNPTWLSSSSGAGGTFTFGGVPNGTYRLTAYPASNAGEDTDYYLNTYRSASGSTTEYSSSATISVNDGAVTGQDIALVAGAVVSGRLTANGLALPTQSGWPQIDALQQKAGSWQWAASGSFNSNTGSYRVVAPVGSTRLRVAASGFRTQYYSNVFTAADATAIALTAGDHHTIDMELSAGPKISGVVYAGSTPVQYAQVCAHPVANYASQCSSTSETGVYTIGLDLDPSASYLVEVQKDGYLTTFYATGGSVATRGAASAVGFGGGFDQSGKDLHLIAGAMVSGTVSRASIGPVSGAYVCEDSDQYNCDATDSDGAFSLRVAPGTVRLHASYGGGRADDYFTFTGDSASLNVTDGASYPNTNITLKEGTGLSGAVVRDLPVDVDASLYRVVGSRETWVDNRRIDGENSTFAFRDVTPGTYVVRFTAPGFADACLGGATCTPIVVTDDTLTDVESTSLTRLTPGSLTGTVVDSAGHPLSGVSVEAMFSNITPLQATTDAGGAFSFDSLASRIDWELSFTKAGLVADSREVTVQPGMRTVLPKVHMAGPGTVSGTLTVPSGEDPTSVGVYLEGPAYYSAQVDEAGHYSFPGVVAGRYHLRAEGGGDGILSAWYPGVKSSDEAPRIVVGEDGDVVVDTFALARAATISGDLTDADGDPVGGNVYLYDANDSQVDSVYVSASGQYSFSDVWPGRYTIRGSNSSGAFKTTWLGDTTSIETADRITVAEGESSDGHTITMVARAGGPVTGRVVAHDGTTGVAGIEVAAEYADAATGDDGSFSMPFVPQGTYPVTLSSGNVELCGSELALKCEPASLVVDDHGTSDVTFTLPELGSVTGHLSGPAGVTLSDPSVWLVDATGQEVTWGDPSSGTFTLTSIPFGTYTLVATADGLARTSTPVVVDGTETQDLVLGVKHTISGTVTLEAPVEWMNVELIDPKTGDLVDRVEFGESDSGALSYTFDNVNDGEQYWIRAMADRGREVWYQDADTPRSATKVVASGADVVGIDLTLAAPTDWHTVTGVVTVPNGVTVSDRFDVCLDTPDHDDGSGYGDCTSPAADGSYALTVPGGRYTATVSPPAPLGLVRAEKSIDVTDDATVDFELSAGGSLSGRLADSGGNGVEGDVTASNGTSSAWADTDAYGFWTIDGVPAGNVSIAATADGFAEYHSAAPLTVVAGQDNDAGTQVLTASGSLRIDLADIAGLSEAKVNAIVTDVDGNELARTTIRTGDDGTIAGISAGLVKVRFEGVKVVTEWWKNAVDADRAVAITIANDTTTTIAAALAAKDPVPPATVSGLITNSTGRPGVVRLAAIDQDEQSTVTEVAEDGSYSLSLAPGTYQFRASVCDGLWMGQSGCLGKRTLAWYHGTTIDDAERVVVASGETHGDVDITLKGVVRTFTVGTPAIAGTAKVGQELTASRGTWTPSSGVTYSYRWFRGDVTLGAGVDYRLQAADLGKTVSVEVTAKKAGYADATSDPVTTDTVVKGTLDAAKPSIDGTAAVGETLTAKHGSWTEGTAFTYQWKRDGGAIDGATHSTYKLVDADANTTISVTVSGTQDGYEPDAKTSDGVTVHKPQTGAGTVSLQAGSWNVGVTVTAVPSGWPAGASLSFQWKRNGVAIAGATGSTYTLQAADQGAAVSVTVTGSIAGQEPASTDSSASGVIQAPLKKLTKGKVSISGTAKVGKKLSAKVGKWKPSGIKYRYQWLRNGVVISGATKSTYKIAKADKKSKISVRVTATKAGYADLVVTSKATSKVK